MAPGRELAASEAQAGQHQGGLVHADLGVNQGVQVSLPDGAGPLGHGPRAALEVIDGGACRLCQGILVQSDTEEVDLEARAVKTVQPALQNRGEYRVIEEL